MKRTGTFARGTNAGTATCRTCGRLRQKANMERETGPLAICVDCYALAGDENGVEDGEITRAEFDARWSAYIAQYGIAR